MDQGLFSKHLKNILIRNSVKQNLIQTILEKTSIPLEESEVQISKKEVVLLTSSVKKTALLKKNIQQLLTEDGYTLKN